MDLLTRGNALSTSSVIVSKELLHASNGFSEDKAIISAEDFELWLRLADQGANFRFINKSLGSYRMHAQSNSSGKSARAAANVVSPYRSRLAPKELKRLDGWLAYAIAVDSSSRKVRIAHLSEAARLATFRFKWRAIIRLCSLR
jgi:GT2 family glycosyltransferase